MDRNRAHDVIHIWNGNKTENCPVCKGEMISDEDIMSCAKDIAAQNYYPRINPSMESQAIWCDDKTKVESADAPKEITAGDGTKKASSRAFSVMTDVMSFSEGQGVPSRIKIIPTGKFNTAKYGPLEITREQLEEMAQNFYAGARAGGATTGLPIDIEHGETSHRDEAAGWIKDIVVMNDGAYADVEWTELGKGLLEKGIYKFYSPEFTFEYVDNETSAEISNVVIGGGLVNKPLFDHSLPPLMMSEDGKAENLTTNQAPHMLYISNSTQSSAEMSTNSESESLQASEKEKPMDLQTILAKGKTERTSDEQLFVFNNLSELTREQKISEGFEVAAEAAPVADAVVAQEQAPAVEAAPVAEVAAPDDNAPVKSDAAIAASEKTVIAAEVESLKERLAAAEAKNALAFAEIEKKEVAETVRKFVFNEKGGKFAPAQEAEVIDLMLGMKAPERAKFVKFMEGLPDKGQMLFEEKGSDENLGKGTAKDLLIAKANELVKEKKMAFRDAYSQVTTENPALAEKADQE